MATTTTTTTTTNSTLQAAAQAHCNLVDGRRESEPASSAQLSSARARKQNGALSSDSTKLINSWPMLGSQAGGTSLRLRAIVHLPALQANYRRPSFFLHFPCGSRRAGRHCRRRRSGGAECALSAGKHGRAARRNAFDKSFPRSTPTAVSLWIGSPAAWLTVAPLQLLLFLLLLRHEHEQNEL